MIITKIEYIRKKRERSARQNEQDLEQKLKFMQQSTDKPLDDKISGEIDQNVSKTVRTILSTAPNAFTANERLKRQKHFS